MPQCSEVVGRLLPWHLRAGLLLLLLLTDIPLMLLVLLVGVNVWQMLQAVKAGAEHLLLLLLLMVHHALPLVLTSGTQAAV
jgi:hypothetical protein